MRVMVKIFLYWFCFVQPTASYLIDWGYKNMENAKNARFRIFQMMRGVIIDNQRRVNDLQDYRSMYEESPHYEIGYVFGEIIERYRKLVEINRGSFNWKVDFHNRLYYLEHAQNVYLELYHLGNMLHEIIPKYQHVEDFIYLKDEMWYIEMVDQTKFKPGSKKPQRLDRKLRELERRKRLLEIEQERRRKQKEYKDFLKSQKELYGGGNINRVEQHPQGGYVKYFDLTTAKNNPFLIHYKYYFKPNGNVEKYRYYHGNASFEKLPSPGFQGWYKLSVKPDPTPRPPNFGLIDYGWEVKPYY